MSTTTTPGRVQQPLWADEPAQEGRARFRARVGGLHCSLCTGTLERALARHDGVHQVAVSLTHEQALVEYDPARVSPQELAETLRAIGYPASDPRKVRPYEEEEEALVREDKRLLLAVAASLMAIALTFDPDGWVGIAVPAVVGASLVAIAFLILRPGGTLRALAGALGFGALVAGLLACARSTRSGTRCRGRWARWRSRWCSGSPGTSPRWRSSPCDGGSSTST